MPFGPWSLAFIATYLVALLAIGFVGYRHRRGHSLSDFYLAGRQVGFVVLLLTMYSTQYSGNTLFGFSGRTYRDGFSWAMSVHFMTAIVVVYLTFAPRLQQLAHQFQFITPTDFLTHRFRHRGLSSIATLIMIIALANYLLAQLMAIGRAMEGLVPENPETAYIYGVVGLGCIIGIYETLGGFRAVIWTDVMQGTVLILGFALLLVLVLTTFGPLHEATQQLMASSPEKTAVPSAAVCREWASYVVLVGLGGALYPHAIQRIYAARGPRVLRHSLIVMGFLPLTTTLVSLIVGIIGAARFPGLEREQADAILSIICRHIQQQSAWGNALVVLLFAAVLAAIMSTADSALLSISSMFTKDLYSRARPQTGEAGLTRIGRACSWLVLGTMSAMAIGLREDTTLVKLLDRKFELLVQLAPAFLGGVWWSRSDGRAEQARYLRGDNVMWGLLVGVAVAVPLDLSGTPKPWGIHAGLYGLLANVVLLAILEAARGPAPDGSRSGSVS